MGRAISSVRWAIVVGAGAITLAAAGCTGNTPASSAAHSDESLQKEAQIHKQMHEREARNR